jgi:hypothetical protein
MSIKMIFASTAALAMIAGTPAFAAKTPNQQQLAASDSDGGGGAGVQAKGERKICRFIDSTESRMKRERLCFTRAEWKKIDDAE